MIGLRFAEPFRFEGRTVFFGVEAFLPEDFAFFMRALLRDRADSSLRVASPAFRVSGRSSGEGHGPHREAVEEEAQGDDAHEERAGGSREEAQGAADLARVAGAELAAGPH